MRGDWDGVDSGSVLKAGPAGGEARSDIRYIRKRDRRGGCAANSRDRAEVELVRRRPSRGDNLTLQASPVSSHLQPKFHVTNEETGADSCSNRPELAQLGFS